MRDQILNGLDSYSGYGQFLFKCRRQPIRSIQTAATGQGQYEATNRRVALQKVGQTYAPVPPKD